MFPTGFRSHWAFLKRGLLIPLFAACISSLPSQAQTLDPVHAWNAGGDPASLETWVDQRLGAAQADVEKLVAVTGSHTVANTLRPYDDAINELALASNETYFMFAVGNSAAVRNKAQALYNKVSSASTNLSLNQNVYRALKAEPSPEKDPAASHYLQRTLLEYRLAGVDKDDATRAKIRQLQDKITALSLTFSRNVADDVRNVTATKAQLDGLPEDYIARHKPNADGVYTLTTDAPDFRPVGSFATNSDLRLRMFLAYNQRAYPKNKAVLMDLLTARQELATTLGFATFADFATADQMIGSQQNLKSLLQQVDVASRDTAAREYALLLAFAQKQQPGLTNISLADSTYWSEQYRRANYNFDAQSVRPYFPYNEVQAGILKTAERLFHIEFKGGAGREGLGCVGLDLRRVRQCRFAPGKEAGPDLPGHAPARRQGQVVFQCAPCSRHRRTAASRGSAHLQLPRRNCRRSRPNAIRRSGHLLPRVRALDASHPRRSEPMGG